MKSFSSSAINKSGRKFAPKAPVRRAAPAAAPPPRRPSVASQVSTSQVSASQTPKPPTQTATPEPAPPTSTIESPAPHEAPAIESSTPQNTSVAPTPPPTAPSVATTVTVTSTSTATAIPVPRPKRTPSFSAPTPVQLPPRSPKAPPTEPTPIPSIELAPNEQPEIRGPARESHEFETPVTNDQSLPNVSSTETRPAKRQKTATGPSTIVPEVQQPKFVPPLATPPATQTSTNEETTEGRDSTESQPPADQTRKTTRTRKRKTSKDDSSGNAADKPRQRKTRARKKREPTPEGAEDIEITPATIKMSELCKDLRTGKISKRETELRQMELAEMERKQKAQQEGENADQTPIKNNEDANTPAPNTGDLGDSKAQSGPVMRIVNGEIVLDAASLEVDRHADAARNAGDLEDVVENSLTRKVNQASFGKRSKTESWDEDMTDLFYRGLRMFGTDFMMISKLFPGRSRRQIKLKFNNEERRDPGRIKDTLLGPREMIDITTYSEMTNTVYDDPKVIQQELDDEKKRIEDQHAKEKKAQEDLVNNPDGTTGDGQLGDQGKGDNAPVKSRRNNKKRLAGMGGNEEILGSIDDFP
ncbi:hypothetical protein BDV25DRAFT_60849 [Aspergillus avenaceus]|uniref:Myb-like domain-containing protein n=1 Tax=Aspergillus avenaceus TaxID=36643 RepID=A0A5N6THR8_ASPAV|nr:hypothetical protein BDV25DRAFT_60849 [Aspergillus avenaceus]